MPVMLKGADTIWCNFSI